MSSTTVSTPRSLLIVALDPDAGRSLEPGDVSLALAGAELVDLLALGSIRLDGERIVPVRRGPAGDRLLDDAAASLVRQEPYELIGDWLWRRGRGLFTTYAAAHEAGPPVVGEPAPVSGDAVLAALATTAGLRGDRTAAAPDIADDAVATVLDAVDAAVSELGLARLRRSVEDAAFDNVWRGE